MAASSLQLSISQRLAALPLEDGSSPAAERSRRGGRAAPIGRELYREDCNRSEVGVSSCDFESLPVRGAVAQRRFLSYGSSSVLTKAQLRGSKCWGPLPWTSRRAERSAVILRHRRKVVEGELWQGLGLQRGPASGRKDACATPEHAGEAFGSDVEAEECGSSGSAQLEGQQVGDIGGRERSQEERDGENGSLLRVAGIVGIATTASKFLGMVRETALASAFGVGPVMNAFSYAGLVPMFFLSHLGGINGVFHSAIVASLSKRPKGEGRVLVEKVSTLVGMVLVVAAIGIVLAAGPLIDMSAPGLAVSNTAEGILTRNIAIAQLRMMAPSACLAGLIGVGYGTLSYAGVYALPSLCPSLSSLCILTAVAVHYLRFGDQAGHISNAISGGLAIAVGSTAGSAAQWLMVSLTQLRMGLGSFRLRFSNPFTDESLQEVLAVMVPAAVGSSMMQIATYTDLYFASFLPGAAAGLGYANLLVQAPLGILSSGLLVPILPLFARLSHPDHWPELKQRVRQGLLLSAIATLPLTATLVPLSRPIVRVLFQRHSFDGAASSLVSSLVVCYASGAIAYLARDVLVRVYYALGDGRTPFVVSACAIFANAFLDWLLVRVLGFGAEGLVLATLFANVASAGVLLALLNRRLGGLRMHDWLRPGALLACATVASTVATSFTYASLAPILLDVAPLLVPSSMVSSAVWFADLCTVGCGGLFGLITFFATLLLLRLPEAEHAVARIRSKLSLA